MTPAPTAAGSPTPRRIEPRHAIALLFAVSFCALAFEVALTRVCSAVLLYHVSFAVVSLAVLGVGLGGFLAYLATGRAPARVTSVVTAALLAISPGILLALFVLLRLPFAAHWPLLLFLTLPPFAAVGAVQALLMRALAQRASAIYAADLAGGAVGAAAAAFGIDRLGGPVNWALLLALAVAAVAAGWAMWSARTVRARFVGAGLCALAFAAVVGQGATRLLDVRYELAPQKLVAQMLQRGPHGVPRLLPELQRWDATSRVDVLELRSPRGVQRLVFIDGETPTAMLAPDARAPGAAALAVDAALPALPYRLLAPRRVLAIGSGGGYDVVVAKRFGAEHVDAVELNAGVLDVVGRAREFTGDVYRQPGVQLHHAEGRQFVESAAPATYDFVSLVLAQSLAGNLREYALSENYLYTREAFSSYVDALRPGGAVVLLVNDDILLLRLFTTAWDVLAERGQNAPECLVALASRQESPYDRLLLVGERPFTATVLAALAAAVAERGYEPMHLPPATPGAAGQQQPRPSDVQLQPATDDRPFVFNLQDGMPPALVLLLASATVLLAGAWGALGYYTRARRADAALAPAVYFVCLGLGFLMLEVLVLQKSILVVGHPTLNLSLVLCTFLLAAGSGSAVSARFSTQHALRLVLLLLIPILGLVVRGLDVLHDRAVGWSLAARCAGVVLVVSPCAFLMGMPFPLGIRLLPRALADFIPWFWGLNGVASILGSALVVACVLEAGFRVATLLPILVYLLAAAATLRFQAGSGANVSEGKEAIGLGASVLDSGGPPG